MTDQRETPKWAQVSVRIDQNLADMMARALDALPGKRQTDLLRDALRDHCKAILAEYAKNTQSFSLTKTDEESII